MQPRSLQLLPQNDGVRRVCSLVIVLDGFAFLEAELFVKLHRIITALLDVEVDLLDLHECNVSVSATGATRKVKELCLGILVVPLLDVGDVLQHLR